MWDSVDAVGINMEPIRDFNPAYIIFHIFLVVIICMLFLNLFVGIVCDTYNKEKALLSLNHLLSESERMWIEIRIMAYKAKPKILLAPSEVDYSCFRNQLIKIVTSYGFEVCIIISILLNSLILAVQYYQMDEDTYKLLNKLNYLFMAIFILEITLKILAMRCLYFKDPWNTFDFIVIILYIIVLIINLSPVDIDLRSQATIIRILRILRVLKIIKRA